MSLSNIQNNKGFTLAEVILTIGLIGVIAAFVMPVLLNNIQQKVREHSAAVFTRKFASVVEMVPATNSFGKIQSTSEFVNNLEKHLNITKRCEANNITDCWTTNRIKLYDGSDYNIANAVNGETSFLMNFKDPTGKAADYTSNNVALVLADGTHVLLNYNKECDSDNSQFSQNCIVALFDINGQKGPNEVGKDLVLFNAKNFIKSEDGDDPVEAAGSPGSREPRGGD